MNHAFRFLSCSLALVLGAAPAAAQPSPLAQLPTKTPLVVAMRCVKRTTDRFLALAKSAAPEHAKDLQSFVDGFSKVGLPGGRRLDGLKDDGHLFLVLPSLPKLDKLVQPDLALIARVTDYKAFRDGLLTADERKTLTEDKAHGWEMAKSGAAQVYFIARGDYAVFCSTLAAATELARKDQGAGLEGTLAKPVAQKLLEADVALYIDLAAVNKEYGPVIKTAKLALGGLLDQGTEENSKLDKNLTEMIKGIYASLIQLEDDATYLLISCDMKPSGLGLHMAAGLVEGSKTNQVLKTMKPSTLAGLAGLPAGFTTYTAVDFGPEAYKAFRPVASNLMAVSGERGDQASEKALSDALDDVLDAKPRQVFSASKLGTGRGSLQVWQYGDSGKALAAQLRMFKALKEGSSAQLIPLKSKPIVKADAQAYGDTKLHRAVLKWDVEKLGDNLLGAEETAAMLRKLSGDGTIVWFGSIGKHVVQVTAKDWKAAGDHLDKFTKKEGTIGADKPFMEARGNLPPEASLVTLVQASAYCQHFAEFLNEALKAQGSKGVKPSPHPEPKPPDSYLGFAVTMQPGEASCDVWIPATAGRELSRVLGPALKHLAEK